MNLGAFAAVIAVAERTGSKEIDDWAGLGRYSPVLATLLGVFFFALAGILPLAGGLPSSSCSRRCWAKGAAAGGGPGGGGGRQRGDRPVLLRPGAQGGLHGPRPQALPDGASVSRPLAAALALTAAVTTLAAGFYPQMIAFFGEAARALALP